jgi:phosphoglycolate phosphatase
MTAPTVVFDLDGTLVDTAPDLVHATNHVLGGAGFAHVPGEVLRPYISFGSRRMIVEGLAHHDASLPDGDIDGMWAAFLAYYAANIAVDSRPYPGIEDRLRELAGRGVRLAVCTNKVEDLSRKLLGTLGLLERFQAVCGRNTFAVCKPHPDHLLGTIAAAGGTPARAVMVGDSDTDVATARAAGVPIIGVTFGYTDVPMRELDPDVVIEHYDEFGEALQRAGAGRGLT